MVDTEEMRKTMKKRVIRCRKCYSPIGVMVEIGGQEWLSVSGIRVTVMRGVCACGEEFHWSISEQALAKLIARVKTC